MAIIACPQCQKKLQLPDSFAGKQVQCPGCKNVFAPVLESDAAPPPPPLPSIREDAPPPSRREDSYEDRPRRPRNDDEDEERRPRRRRDDEDEDDNDRPRRRRLKPHRGSTIQLLGILSIFVAQLILGPMAWIMGSSDLKEMDEGIMDPRGRSETQTGKTIGMVMTIISLVGIVGCGLFYCLILAAAGPRGFH